MRPTIFKVDEGAFCSVQLHAAVDVDGLASDVGGHRGANRELADVVRGLRPASGIRLRV